MWLCREPPNLLFKKDIQIDQRNWSSTVGPTFSAAPGMFRDGGGARYWYQRHSMDSAFCVHKIFTPCEGNTWHSCKLRPFCVKTVWSRFLMFSAVFLMQTISSMKWHYRSVSLLRLSLSLFQQLEFFLPLSFDCMLHVGFLFPISSVYGNTTVLSYGYYGIVSLVSVTFLGRKGLKCIYWRLKRWRKLSLAANNCLSFIEC